MRNLQYKNYLCKVIVFFSMTYLLKKLKVYGYLCPDLPAVLSRITAERMGFIPFPEGSDSAQSV